MPVIGFLGLQPASAFAGTSKYWSVICLTASPTLAISAASDATSTVEHAGYRERCDPRLRGWAERTRTCRCHFDTIVVAARRRKASGPTVFGDQRESAQYFNGFLKMTFASSSPPTPALNDPASLFLIRAAAAKAGNGIVHAADSGSRPSRFCCREAKNGYPRARPGRSAQIMRILWPCITCTTTFAVSTRRFA
jgi:hypothetical protein